MESYLENIDVSEDDVARRQAEEDLRLYGNRPQPADAIGDHESADQKKTQPKRELSKAELADQRPLIMRRIGERAAPTTQLVTAMDWNSGASPLHSWLNQSAIPSLLPEPVEEPPQVSMKDLIERETEEIKVFRSVHVSMAHEIETRAYHGDNEDFANLSLGAQVYYRNIMDRYPQIPTYLARRLAEGNLERAQRLEASRLIQEREKSRQLEILEREKSRQLEILEREKSRQLEILEKEKSRLLGVKAQRKAEIEQRCQNLQPPIPSDILPQLSSFRATMKIPQLLTESEWEFLRPLLSLQSLSLEPPEEQAVNQIKGLSYSSPTSESSHEGFWQGGRPRRRPSSADSLHSRSSSVNSSLHGSRGLIAMQSNDWMSDRDPETRRSLMHFSCDTSGQESSPCETWTSGRDPETTRGLLPPPVNISEQKSFECDICGQTIRIRRRREWQ